MANDNDGCASILMFIGILLLITAAIIGFFLTISFGSVYGAGIALVNYGKAFLNNIKPE
jgi:hypothetical protein